MGHSSSYKNSRFQALLLHNLTEFSMKLWVQDAMKTSFPGPESLEASLLNMLLIEGDLKKSHEKHVATGQDFTRSQDTICNLPIAFSRLALCARRKEHLIGSRIVCFM